MTTTNHLRDLGFRARERFGTPIHNCKAISDVLADLCKRGDIPAEVHERAVGEKRVTHFVVMLASSEISDIDTDNGTTYIDPTIDQFSLENWQDGTVTVGLGRNKDLPEVGIYPPNCEERKVWYHRK